MEKALGPAERLLATDAARREALLPETHPMMASPLVMEGDEGGVAATSLARPEVDGGDVEGTVRLMMGESSPSPAKDGKQNALVIGGKKKQQQAPGVATVGGPQ